MNLIVVNLGERTKRWLTRSRAFAWVVQQICRANVSINQQYLKIHRVPPLYTLAKMGRVRYKNEPNDGIEEFAIVPVILKRGWGDCDDLAPWRCAELRNQGENANIRITWRMQSKGRLFHVVVRRGDGTIEDPSRKLGM